MCESERKFPFFMPDFFRTKTGKFEIFCPMEKWRFLKNSIRPPHLYSGVLDKTVTSVDQRSRVEYNDHGIHLGKDRLPVGS